MIFYTFSSKLSVLICLLKDFKVFNARIQTLTKIIQLLKYRMLSLILEIFVNFRNFTKGFQEIFVKNYFSECVFDWGGVSWAASFRAFRAVRQTFCVDLSRKKVFTLHLRCVVITWEVLQNHTQFLGQSLLFCFMIFLCYNAG